MNLYDNIAEVCTDPRGWCSLVKAQTLASLVIGTRPDIIVEIGVWSGKSLLPMALACKEVGHGMVIGIDPYEAAASAEGQSQANAEWWSNAQAHQEMHDFFMAEVNRLGLQNVVRLIRHRSGVVEPPANIGLLHSDGNHGRQAVSDVKRFSPAVRLGGFVVLDDLHWDGGAVSDAADWLIFNGFHELFRVVTPPPDHNDWAVFQRIR